MRSLNTIPYAVLAFCLALSLSGGPAANAAGRGMSFPEDDKLTVERHLEKAERYIERGEFEDALAQLEKARKADPKNADAFNLTGYATRRLGRLDEAGNYYEEALRLDPDHRGALEYQGELFLKLGDIASARANLERLQSECGSCEEYEMLAAAIETVEAGGELGW